MQFQWAEPYPDLLKICTLFTRNDLLSPSNVVYKPLQAYRQKGPQCGPVALAMLMGAPCEDKVDKIVDFALKTGLSFNGELFSVEFMHELAEHFLSDKVQIHVGPLNSQSIKQFLLQGGQILVPYDTNKDHSPGLFKGHKAHWAAVSGAIQTEEQFFVVARHGKTMNVAIWTLEDLSESNLQLEEFSPDRKLHDVEYKLPEGGVLEGLCGKCVLVG